MSGPVDAAWTATPALRRAALLPAALLGGGLVLGRPDVALLAAPLVVGTVLSLARRPAGTVTAVAAAPATAGQGRAVAVTTTLALPADATLACVLVPDGTTAPHAVAAALAPAPGAAARRLGTAVTPDGWGRVGLARPDVSALACDGLLAVPPRAGAPVSVTVLPAVDDVPPAALPPRPAGLVGGHRTRRPGDGTDLLDVRPFRPGDRLRRVDWRVTARRAAADGSGGLHVRRTAADADADVVLLLDPRHDLGRDGATWAGARPLPAGAHRDEASTLGRTVRTATALAAAHLRHGDRVSLVDLARPGDGVASGAGRRHLLRVRHHLALSRAVGTAELRVRPGVVPPGALAVVLSPFLDDAPADVAVDLRRRGALVVAVDVLPDDVVPDTGRAWRAEALGVLLAERAVRLRRLAAAGVDVLPADPAALAARLARRRRR